MYRSIPNSVLHGSISFPHTGQRNDSSSDTPVPAPNLSAIIVPYPLYPAIPPHSLPPIPYFPGSKRCTRGARQRRKGLRTSRHPHNTTRWYLSTKASPASKPNRAFFTTRALRKTIRSEEAIWRISAASLITASAEGRRDVPREWRNDKRPPGSSGGRWLGRKVTLCIYKSTVVDKTFGNRREVGRITADWCIPISQGDPECDNCRRESNGYGIHQKFTF